MSKPTDGALRWKAIGPARDIDVAPPTPPAPFRYERPVSWGDCDPAQIAYTGNVPGWCLEAIEGWYKACLGVNWYEINLDHGFGTPFVHLENDFKSPITARDPLTMIVRVTRLGGTSIAHHIDAYQGERLCFTGDYASAFVAATEMKPIRIPDRMRAAIERFIAAQDA